MAKKRKPAREVNFWRFTFRPKSQFILFRQPDWAENIVKSVLKSKTKKDLNGQIIIGKTKANNWLIHAILIDKRIEDKQKAMEIANLIQDKVEREGEFTPKKYGKELQKIVAKEGATQTLKVKREVDIYWSKARKNFVAFMTNIAKSGMRIPRKEAEAIILWAYRFNRLIPMVEELQVKYKIPPPKKLKDDPHAYL